MKQATSIEEQITKLKNRGIIIADENKAEEILLDIGYYRLGFYSFPFEENYPYKKKRTHKYTDNINFNDIITLYYFDNDLRNILQRYIQRIEINFKTIFAYKISQKYPNSNTWFIDPAIVSSAYIRDFSKDYGTYSSLKKNELIKKHHAENINDRYAPFWKTLEFMSFGNIENLYSNLKNKDDKELISSHYGIGQTQTFFNYINTLRKIRNICAHGGMLFDINLGQSIKAQPANINSLDTNKIKGVTMIVKYMLSVISENRSNDLDKEINALLEKHKTNKVLRKIIEEASHYKFSV